MESTQRILIASDWKRPYLLFEHHYRFDRTANLLIKADGPWEILWSFPASTSSGWSLFEVNLSKYKGKEILLRFTIDYWSNEWSIRNIRIVPEYH